MATVENLPFPPPSPPPPPLSPAVAGEESGTDISPFIITLISILATALLLAGYYIHVSKRGASLSLSSAGDRREDCRSSPSGGLTEALIDTVWRYKREEGVVEGTDCSVCLSEFGEEESLRLLPKCGHAFHLQCIDTWFKSHANCPLCRNNVMSAVPAMPVPGNLAETALEIVVMLENAERREEEEGENHRSGVVEIGEEDCAEPLLLSLLMRSSASDEGRVSGADVLQGSLEDED